MYLYEWTYNSTKEFLSISSLEHEGIVWMNQWYLSEGKVVYTPTVPSL